MVVSILQVLEEGRCEQVLQLWHVEQLDCVRDLLNQNCMLPPHANLLMYVVVKEQ